MNRTVLQIPLSKELKLSAEKAALEAGFSSLQEVLRVFMNKFASKKIDLTFEENIVHLSKKNERRYMKMTEDFKKGRNIYTASSVEDLMKQLHEHKLP